MISCPSQRNGLFDSCEGVFANGIFTGFIPAAVISLLLLAIGFYFINRVVLEAK
jgi:hypothetical protein